MTTKLIFTVDYENITPDELKKIIAYQDAYCAISEIKSLFRDILKYGVMGSHSEIVVEGVAYDIVERIEEKIFEICEDVIND